MMSLQLSTVAAEELVILAEEQKKLAQGTFDTVAKQVDATADPVFKKVKLVLHYLLELDCSDSSTTRKNLKEKAS